MQGIPHTRDWVVWEAGVAKNKDIWVFEPYSQFSTISTVIPCLRHYVLFDTNDEWLGYLRQIIDSYDDSHVLPTTLLASAIGAGLAAAVTEKDKAGGAALGALAGAFVGSILSNKSEKRPVGLQVTCAKCHSSFSIHIPQGMKYFRCPPCNSLLKASGEQ